MTRFIANDAVSNQKKDAPYLLNFFADVALS